MAEELDHEGAIRRAMQKLADEGRRGDTMLAHINPQEAQMLHQMGGSGTVNPETGLPEFFGGGDPAGPGGPGVGGATGHGGPGSGTSSGPGHGAGQGGNIGGDPGGGGGGADTTAVAGNLGGAQTSAAADAQADAAGLANQAEDSLLGLGMFGVDRPRTMTQQEYSNYIDNRNMVNPQPGTQAFDAAVSAGNMSATAAQPDSMRALGVIGDMALGMIPGSGVFSGVTSLTNAVEEVAETGELSVEPMGFELGSIDLGTEPQGNLGPGMDMADVSTSAGPTGGTGGTGDPGGDPQQRRDLDLKAQTASAQPQSAGDAPAGAPLPSYNQPTVGPTYGYGTDGNATLPPAYRQQGYTYGQGSSNIDRFKSMVG